MATTQNVPCVQNQIMAESESNLTRWDITSASKCILWKTQRETAVFSLVDSYCCSGGGGDDWEQYFTLVDGRCLLPYLSVYFIL